MKGTAVRNYLLILLLISFSSIGCSNEAKKSEYLTRANQAFESGQYEQAEIEYLNVLRLDRANPLVIRNLGIMAAEQGRLGQAFALLTRAKTNDPTDFQVHFKLAQCMLAGGLVLQAHEETLLLLDKQPANEDLMLMLLESSVTTNQIKQTEQRLAALQATVGDTAGFHLASGTIQLRKRDFQSAERSFQKSLELNPKSSAACVAMGNLCAARNEPKKAEVAYEKAAELAPARSHYSLAYADFKLAAKDFVEAKKALEKISKKTPDYLPVQLRLAQLALTERRLADCENILTGMLGRDPTHLEAMLLLARLQVEQDEPAKAIAVLEKAIKEYPKIPRIYYQLALAHLNNDEDEAGAISRLNQALGIQPNFAPAIMLLAELNVRRGDANSAVTSLRKLVADRRDLPGAYLLLAMALRERGDDDAAIKVYEELGRLYPANPQISLRLGMLLRQKGQSAEARKSFERALAIAPSYRPALEQLVNLDLSEKRVSVARQTIQKKLEIDSKDAGLYLLLGKVYLAETNFALAESTLRKAAELAPDSGDARALLGRIYLATNREKEALLKLEEVVARNTNDIASWLQIAQLYSASSNYAAAKVAYEKILKINPQFIPALNNLAWLYLEHLDDTKRAHELASKARRLQPKDPSIADTLGWVFYKMEDYSRALALLKESATDLPHEPEVMFHLGMVYYRVGEEAAAKTAFRHALESAREEPWRKEVEMRLRILEMNSTDAALKMVPELEGLLEDFPNDTILLIRLAEISEAQTNWTKAVTYYDKALSINPNLVPAMIGLAREYSAHLKDPQRAILLARRARKLEPLNPVIGHALGKLAYDSAANGADYEWAFSLLQESARKLPDNPAVQFDYAWATYAIGQRENAVKIMQIVANLNAPSISLPAQKFVRMNGLWGNPLQAEENVSEIKTILVAEPSYAPALMVLGVIQEKSGEFKLACETYERVLKKFPLFSPANKILAKLYFGPNSDTAKAYAHANRARTANPHDTEVSKILGTLEYDRAKYSRAAQLLAESARDFPTDADLHYRLGFAYRNLKQNKESRQTLMKALELSPTSPWAIEAKQLVVE